jgi:hypothetical protein
MKLVGLIAVATCSGSHGSPDGAVSRDARAPDAAAATCPTPGSFGAEVTVVNDPPSAAGSFDPSVVYPGDASGGVMAYSAVPDQLSIRTRIAGSTDHGATWTFAAEINQPEPVALPCTAGTCTGNLISEVSALVFDADDPDVSRRWKLFAHRYLVSPGAPVVLRYDIGTIVLQTAPAPQGPWTAPAKWIGWTATLDPAAAYSSTGIVTNIDTLAGDADCVALTEPSALWLPGTIELALGCLFPRNGSIDIRIILVRSVDHAASWHAVSTLLTSADSTCLAPGGPINAANLFVAGGKEYLSTSPSRADGGYRGCEIFAIDDPATGTVHRDAMGHALPIRTMTSAQFSGGCTFAERGGGYFADVLFSGTRPFRILRGPATGP